MRNAIVALLFDCKYSILLHKATYTSSYLLLCYVRVGHSNLSRLLRLLKFGIRRFGGIEIYSVPGKIQKYEHHF